MSKIVIEKHKSLKLINVLVRKRKEQKVIAMHREIEKFMNFMEVTKIQRRGPFIVKQSNSTVSPEGMILADFDFMSQTVQTLKNNKALGMTFKPTIKVSNCLYSRFKGDINDLEYVRSKMRVMIWEEELLDSGEEYTVYLNSQDDYVEVDLFKPILSQL